MEIRKEMDTETYIPSTERKIVRNNEGRVTYRLRQIDAHRIGNTNMPQAVRYSQSITIKIIESVGGALLAFLCLGFVVGNLFLPLITEGFYIAGPLLLIVGCVLIGGVISKWTGDEANRQLLLDSQGVKLDGWRMIKWGNITELCIKEFSGGDVGIINYYLIIESNGRIICHNISKLKSDKPRQIVLMQSDVDGIKKDLAYFWDSFNSQEQDSPKTTTAVNRGRVG